jgi:NADH:ubiquinone oxidoreductase subunit E
VFSQASHNSRLSAVAPVPGAAAVLSRVADLIADLRPDDADLLRGLHRIQHEFGYVPPEAVPLLAAKLRTTPALIFGAIDFYSELRQEPPAENVVEWCSGPACLLKNSMGIRRALEAVLGCAMDRKSIDGRNELRLVQCDGTCRLAPLVRYRGRYLGPLSTSEAITFARGLVPTAPAVPDVPTPEPAALGAEAPGPVPEAGEPAASGETTLDVPGPRPPLPPGEDPTREPGE